MCICESHYFQKGFQSLHFQFPKHVGVFNLYVMKWNLISCSLGKKRQVFVTLWQINSKESSKFSHIKYLQLTPITRKFQKLFKMQLTNSLSFSQKLFYILRLPTSMTSFVSCSTFPWSMVGFSSRLALTWDTRSLLKWPLVSLTMSFSKSLLYTVDNQYRTHQ